MRAGASVYGDIEVIGSDTTTQVQAEMGERRGPLRDHVREHLESQVLKPAAKEFEKPETIAQPPACCEQASEAEQAGKEAMEAGVKS